MFSNILFAWCLMALCVAIHAMGLTVAFSWLKRRPMPREGELWMATWLLIRIAGWTMLVHLMQITVWASFFVWERALPDWHTAVYFSMVTYTTTGYGDILLPESLRLFGGVEALTGILMCGLSTGMFFAVFSKVFGYKIIKGNAQ